MRSFGVETLIRAPSARARAGRARSLRESSNTQRQRHRHRHPQRHRHSHSRPARRWRRNKSRGQPLFSVRGNKKKSTLKMCGLFLCSKLRATGFTFRAGETTDAVSSRPPLANYCRRRDGCRDIAIGPSVCARARAYGRTVCRVPTKKGRPGRTGEGEIDGRKRDDRERARALPPFFPFSAKRQIQTQNKNLRARRARASK